MSDDFRSTRGRAPEPGDPGPRIFRPERPPTARDGNPSRPTTSRDGGPATTRDAAPYGGPARGHTTRDVGPSTTRDAAGFPGSARPVGGSDFPLPHHLAAEYDIVDDTLGTGGEADVAVLRHRGDGALRVVKVYRRGITLPQSFVDRLATADPAHVLPVTRSTYTGWTSPRFIEVMDYLPHGSLETLLDQSGGSAPDLAQEILVEMTDALDYIHTQLQIVHRDIKPGNVMIRTAEPLDLVLADLGIAAEVAELRRSRRETTGGVKGTLVYQSPETLNMSDAGAPRDWWALGMTICEVLTGQHPFKDGSGNTLRDENMIRHAITMGAIDLSMVNDSRWNLLCRGLLAHDPRDRWGATQVRAWLAGESPAVATHRPSVAGPGRTVRPYRFAGRRFTDPVALADHMVQNWDAAAAVFTSAEECATLRAWVREDVDDPTIDVNTLTPVVSGGQQQADARIIEFTAHYRGGGDLVFRGEALNAQALAVRYLQAGQLWESDELLAALKPNVVAALAETQFDESAGPSRQSGEYYALARLARFAQHVDTALEAARGDIRRAVADWIEGVDVGADVRAALPDRIARARSVGRAALLSPACLDDVRTQFRQLNSASPAWFAAITAQAPTDARPANGADANATEAAVKSLALSIADLAAHYDHAVAAARVAGERRRHAAAAAEAEAARQRAIDARRHEIRGAFSNAGGRAFMLGGVGLFLCFVILANNFMDNPFAPGSYAITIWTLILTVVSCLVIDLTVAQGRDSWLIAGGLVGFALASWYTFSRPMIGRNPLDVSMFWLVGLIGALAYLLSALYARNGRRSGFAG